jgi:hypothetical protein
VTAPPSYAESLSTIGATGAADDDYVGVLPLDVSQPGKDGEYPVYYHHQDAPRARIRATGAWEDEADSAPDFASFGDWLEALSVALVAEAKPEWWDALGTPEFRMPR